jgi:hypothetical protein
MKIRLKVDLHDGHGPRYITTNLFTITEWERQERRKLSDGLGFGASDMAFWAHFLLKRELPRHTENIFGMARAEPRYRY